MKKKLLLPFDGFKSLGEEANQPLAELGKKCSISVCSWAKEPWHSLPMPRIVVYLLGAESHVSKIFRDYLIIGIDGMLDFRSYGGSFFAGFPVFVHYCHTKTRLLSCISDRSR